MDYRIETKSNAGKDKIIHPEPAEFVELLVRVIQNKHIEDRTIHQSFDVRTLQYLHKKYPSIKTALLIEKPQGVKVQVSNLGFTPTIYSPEYRLVDAAVVNDCKAMGMKIIPWTVNEVTKMK